jgi:hypothetical protein
MNCTFRKTDFLADLGNTCGSTGGFDHIHHIYRTFDSSNCLGSHSEPYICRNLTYTGYLSPSLSPQHSALMRTAHDLPILGYDLS